MRHDLLFGALIRAATQQSVVEEPLLDRPPTSQEGLLELSDAVPPRRIRQQQKPTSANQRIRGVSQWRARAARVDQIAAKKHVVLTVLCEQQLGIPPPV